MKKKIIAGILALALVATAFAVVSAQTNSGDSASRGHGGRPCGPCGMSQLTDEERQEMHQQMEEFRQQLAEQYGIDLTDEERQAMQEQLREKQQELHQEMQEFRQQLAEQYGINLTDDELQEMQEQMEECRQELFEQYGISCPAGSHFAGEWGGGPRGPMGLRKPGFEEFPPTPPDLE